ncbi:hypothetical protein ACJMK2_027455, partial [Sinanodonta woodiana]
PPVIGVTDSTFRGETDKSAVIEIPFYSNSSIKTLKFIKHSNSFDISKTSDVSINISTSNIKLTFYNAKVMIPGHVAVLFFTNVRNTDFDNYTLQLFNEIGNVTMVLAFIASDPEVNGDTKVAAIAGGVGAAVVVVVIIVVLFFIWRRKASILKNYSGMFLGYICSFCLYFV